MSDSFAADLLGWYASARRDLPWRRTTDPYAIWVSEIMLQQTRVVAAIPYYERFLQRFPTVQALARASEQELLSAWAGLGYYRRARNLHRAAQQLTDDGVPASYEQLRNLPGVGAYTASAVASIAFGLPHAAVDGNVLRVLTRIRAANASVPEIQQLADTLLDKPRPGEFNQAMMELGATVCLPRAPQCLLCPVASHCRARAEGTQDGLPAKQETTDAIEEKRTVGVVMCDDSLLLWRRTPDSPRMSGFWELPETKHLLRSGVEVGKFRHSIVNHRYLVSVRQVRLRAKRAHPPCEWVATRDAGTLPLSTIARKALAICAAAVNKL
ncbi:MAG TPA: A/G-specific adenine glycosylase [Bryobacteraceae bacterium]|nr:A/G-specific adenine glycosylase [Bryobacteraceae bacterium]